VSLSKDPEWNPIHFCLKERLAEAEVAISVMGRSELRKEKELKVQRQRAKVAEDRVELFKEKAEQSDALVATLEKARIEWAKQQQVRHHVQIDVTQRKGVGGVCSRVLSLSHTHDHITVHTGAHLCR
jgi:hypothetical protein